MLKELMTKYLLSLLLVFAICAPLNALEISKIEHESDGELTLTFCNTIKIKNIDFNSNSVSPTVVFPKEEELYENLSVLNNDIVTQIMASFEGVYQPTNDCKEVTYSLMNTRKVKDKNLVVAKVAFDEDIAVTFLVSSYKKKNKTLYRVRIPSDFKFLSGSYQRAFRKWLIEKTKDLL